MKSVDQLSHVARMCYGNAQDLACSLRGVTSIAEVEEAIEVARSFREGKTKVQMLERHLRKLTKGTKS
jgi:hypothetical protein